MYMIRPDFPIAPFVLCFSFVFSFIFLFYLCLKKTIKIQKETTENNITQKKDLSPKKKTSLWNHNLYFYCYNWCIPSLSKGWWKQYHSLFFYYNDDDDYCNNNALYRIK